MPLHCRIVRQPLLGPAEREDMLALLQTYFDNVRRKVFLEDLAGKDWVIVLRDAPGRLAGFSTIQFFALPPADGPRTVILFSGDTVVDRMHWHTPALAGAFGHVMLRAMEDHRDARLYWLLIAKGYRTYRFLPVYFRRFYPACDREAPPEYPSVLQRAASARFGPAFDAQTGLVRHAGVRDRLRAPFDAVPRGRERDRHVQFFLRRNPTFRDGDELACIAEISRKNLNRFAWRVIRSTEVQWREA